MSVATQPGMQSLALPRYHERQPGAGHRLIQVKARAASARDHFHNENDPQPMESPMNIRKTFLALALLGFAGAVQAAPNCTIKLKGGDNMQFDQKAVTVSASCKTIALEFEHTGKLPAAAMGHNIVVTATADADAVARDGIKAGAAANYVPAGDARVLGSTKIVGGGESTSASMPGNKLKAGGDYSFFCSFPGHSALMRGKITVTP